MWVQRHGIGSLLYPARIGLNHTKRIPEIPTHGKNDSCHESGMISTLRIPGILQAA
jgi:hypothetical protein